MCWIEGFLSFIFVHILYMLFSLGLGVFEGTNALCIY